MAVVEVNGTHLAYRDAGRGPAVLFVHGSLDDLRSWRYQMAPFAVHYRAIAYSRRYHHPNPWAGDGSDYSAGLHAADLAAVIRGLGLAPVHLITSSYGGNIALYLTAQQPELVRSVVLCEPPLLPWLAEIEGGPALWDAFVQGTWLPARRAFEAGDLEAGARAFLDGVMGRPTLDHLPPGARAMIMDNAPEMRAETLANNYFPPFTCADAARIEQPVLLLKSELGPRVFHLIIDALCRCLPRAECGLIPGASHAMHVGNPEAFNEIVLEFLAQH